MDTTVLLITDPTLMPDIQLTDLKRDELEEDQVTVQKILEDLRRELDVSRTDEQTGNRTYMNSFIVEVVVEKPPEDFQLNLFITPDIDIVSKSN